MATHTLNMALENALAKALGSTKGSAKASKARPDTPRRKPHRTGAPVLRDSVEAGTFEDAFFVAPARGETDRILRAARRILDAGRQLAREARTGQRTLTSAERTLTTLTTSGVRVFEEILTLARLNGGRVFPSYDHLAKATSLGRATVARALKTIEAIGFLVRQRRFKRVEDAQGPGPRYEQTSNAYRPSCRASCRTTCRAGCALPPRPTTPRTARKPMRRTWTTWSTRSVAANWPRAMSTGAGQGPCPPRRRDRRRFLADTVRVSRRYVTTTGFL